MSDHFKLEWTRSSKTIMTGIEESSQCEMFQDTMVICRDGIVSHNKLTLGLLLPELAAVPVFCLPIDQTVLLPDYSLAEVQRRIDEMFLAVDTVREEKRSFLSSPAAAAASITSTPAAAWPSTCQPTPIKPQYDRPSTPMVDQHCKAKRKLDMPTSEVTEGEITQTPPVATERADPSFAFLTTMEMMDFVALLQQVADEDDPDFCEEWVLTIELNSKLVVQGLSHLYESFESTVCALGLRKSSGSWTTPKEYENEPASVAPARLTQFSDKVKISIDPKLLGAMQE